MFKLKNISGEEVIRRLEKFYYNKEPNFFINFDFTN
jgi:hypothetical protein